MHRDIMPAVMQAAITLAGYRDDLAQTVQALPLDAIARVIDAILAVRRSGGAVWICGNGGSMATADHLAVDLSKAPAQPVRAISLCNLSALTAWGNDIAFRSVFSGQLAALARPGDLLIAISASGRSPNVVEALSWARAHGLCTVLLTSPHYSAESDIVVEVPSCFTRQIEDCHLAICHMLTAAVAEATDDSADQG